MPQQTPIPGHRPPSQRVVVLGSYAPSLTKFRGPMLAAMAARGHQVVAAAPAIDAATAAELRGLGVEPVSIEISNASLNPVGMWRSYRALRRLLRARRPDLILSYTIKPVILGALAGRVEGVARIASLITGLGFAFTGENVVGRRRMVRQVAASLYRQAIVRSDIVLFQNRDDQATFRSLGILPEHAGSAVVDGSGVDIEQYALARLPAETSFLMIARLLKDKGIREFAIAANRIRREHPEVRVSLVGYLDPSPDSITPEELETIKAGGIEFLGKLDDVRPAIAGCRVYVLPSYREGTPRSVLEAMAMGRAVITTDAPGCRETVIDGTNGYLVPVQDAEGLYHAMKKFVLDPALAEHMGMESRRIAEQRYDARKVSADILGHLGL
ncbi:glycosyltransferase family 4 protein [Sphingosinicella terrae]|uniref:glycosyltransferase family 4 protein n=1 Tax=Sphingosinicella terrae TaxID=2172047 RepID=UPI000E0DFDE2|nr:glycosyltransferase family 4 protein [Sphingosinicella terrae]